MGVLLTDKTARRDGLTGLLLAVIFWPALVLMMFGLSYVFQLIGIY